MSDATAKATVNVRLIGKAQSGEAFALRDFLQRSVVAFDWVELGRDDDRDTVRHAAAQVSANTKVFASV